jgi:hypothetical protein
MNHLASSACVSPAAVVDAPDLDAEPWAERDPLTRINMTAYMETLAERGTLDPVFVNQYAACGPREVTINVSEACRFLRCTEVGSGTSRRHAQAFLDYTKSVGGSADHLPKTVEACWNLVEKVTFRNVYVTFPNMYDIVLYIAKINRDISFSNVTFHYHRKQGRIGL